MPSLLKIAHGSRTLDSGTEWPIDVWISFDGPRYPLALGEGVGHASVGCSMPAVVLLDPQYADVVAACDLGWLVDAIRRLKDSGETITAEQLEACWRARQ